MVGFGRIIDPHKMSFILRESSPGSGCERPGRRGWAGSGPARLRKPQGTGGWRCAVLRLGRRVLRARGDPRRRRPSLSPDASGRGSSVSEEGRVPRVMEYDIRGRGSRTGYGLSDRSFSTWSGLS